MERKRNEKMIAILALCVAVVGLTLGFAAFSNTLKIDSSATVTPNKEDFKLMMYGLPKAYSHDEINPYNSTAVPLSLYSSDTLAGPIIDGSRMDGTIGIIDNDNLSLTNLIAKFTVPDDYLNYIVVIKNEGKYTAYGNILNFTLPSHTCEPGEGATETLVAAACEDIELVSYIGFADENSTEIDWNTGNYIDEKGNIKLEVGEYAYIRIEIGYEYGSVRADGPFTVRWDDIKFDFTTTAG